MRDPGDLFLVREMVFSASLIVLSPEMHQKFFLLIANLSQSLALSKEETHILVFSFRTFLPSSFRLFHVTFKVSNDLDEFLISIKFFSSLNFLQNDTGAPLMCLSSINRTWNLVGILSHEGECLNRSHPDVFTSTVDLIGWISKTIGRRMS